MAEAKLIGRPARWHQPRSVGTCRSAMSQLDLFWFYAKEAMLAACDTKSDEDKRQLSQTWLVAGCWSNCPSKRVRHRRQDHWER